MIINDYSNFKEVNFYVTLEYLTKNLFDEMKVNDEHIKALEKERLNKIKSKSEGL